jgi:4-amino-4-deoxy-L-arabinose transferase-like glycosyltransferase
MNHRWLLVLLATFIGLGVTYSLATPLFEAHDESSHLTVARYLIVNRALPPRVTPERRVTQSGADMADSLRFHDPPRYYAPPLYYAIAALLTAPLGMDDLPALLVPSPSWEAGFAPRANTDPANKNVFAHLAQETFAHSQTVRAAYVLRMLSLALGAVTVACAYALAQVLFPHQPNLALGAAALTALNPHFIFLSSGATNDALLNTIMAVFLVGALTCMRDGAPWTRWLALGAWAGLGCLTKQTALILLPLGGLAILNQPKAAWRKMLGDGAALGSAALLVGGWWYARNAVLYGDPLGLETHFASQTPLASFTFNKALMMFYSYWAAFGWKLILVEPVVYALAACVMGAGLLGMAAAMPRLPSAARRGMMVLAVAVALNLAGLIRWAIATGTSDGRLLFPTLTAASVLLAWGLAQWARWRIARYGLVVTTALAFLFAASVPWRYLRPAWDSPRQVMPATAQPAAADFGSVQLVGYEATAEMLAPGAAFDLTLYWRAVAPNERLRVWVQLGPQDSTRHVAGQDVWLGGTLYPSELWQSGDTVRQVHRLTIPPSAPAPGLYWIRLGLIRSRAGQEAQLARADGGDDAIVLGPWRMGGTLQAAPAHKVDYAVGQAIRLIGYDLDQQSASVQVTLYWQARQTPEADVTVYAHLVDAQERLLGQHDGPPRAGDYPATWWLPGQIVVDRHVVPLNEAYRGPARLRVGMYNPITSERVPVSDRAGRAVPDGAIPLADFALK